MESVNRGAWAMGLELQPGQVHHWVQDGQTWGKVRWFQAFPYVGSIYELPYSKAVEVEQVFTRVLVTKPAPNTSPPLGVEYTLRVEVKVRNVGSLNTHYLIWFAETIGP